jgi:hypothetical protein
MRVASFLKDKREMEALATLNRLDARGLNEVITVFMQFVESAEGNSVSYLNIFPMSQRLMSNLGFFCVSVGTQKPL